MYYVYLILGKKDYKYIGMTNNLSTRINSHNKGDNFSTRPYIPFKLFTYFIFTDKFKAAKFEKYLKSHSGKRFLNRFFL